VLLTPSQRHGSTRLEELLDAVRIPRLEGSPGRPRKRPANLLPDRGDSFESCRGLLRRRGISHTIPESKDQKERRDDPRSIPDIRYTRLNEHYRPAVETARLILRSDSYELRHGAVRGTAFLVDMNRVFEDFVMVALREALSVSQRSFPQGARGRQLFLDSDRKVSLEPYLSWWEGDYCTFVGDVKYKALSESGVVHSDLYQLLSYLIACDLLGGLLVYGSGVDMVTYDIERLGKQLQVFSLNLSGSPEHFLRSIEKLADSIRTLRTRSSKGHWGSVHSLHRSRSTRLHFL
jgi:hypothetical protein